VINMSLSREEEYFIKITKIVLEIVPKYLRKLFIEKWDQKYPNNKWQSDSASGNFVFNEIPNAAKNGRNGVYASNMQSGNESDWDFTTLVYAMLYSQLNLIPSCRPDGQRIAPLLISEEVDIIRKIRNEFFAHAYNMKCSFRTFLDIVSQVHNVAENAFGISAEHEIEEIEKSQITAGVPEHLKKQLHIEKTHNDEYEKVLKGIQDDVTELQNTTEVGADVTKGAAANKQKRKHDVKGIDSKKVKRISKDEHIDTEEATSKKLDLKSVEGILQTSAASRPSKSKQCFSFIWNAAFKIPTQCQKFMYV